MIDLAGGRPDQPGRRSAAAVSASQPASRLQKWSASGRARFSCVCRSPESEIRVGDVVACPGWMPRNGPIEGPTDVDDQVPARRTDYPPQNEKRTAVDADFDEQRDNRR
ncbi:unnamed protein product [Heligmosomoides polygyrus]|uniref:Uncharacterized protein n=1 Tax=Heligmosomoides polygyrus TaxID=6339 RepID=A0A183FKD3_HELPZ|nr:unnamed protein product [Heligmosomoides polygyrus]